MILREGRKEKQSQSGEWMGIRVLIILEDRLHKVQAQAQAQKRNHIGPHPID